MHDQPDNCDPSASSAPGVGEAPSAKPAKKFWSWLWIDLGSGAEWTANAFGYLLVFFMVMEFIAVFPAAQRMSLALPPPQVAWPIKI